AHLARNRTQRTSSGKPYSHSHSHFTSNDKFDWTNTKNRTDVCYRSGLPGHFAQFCISIMLDDVRRRILRNREDNAQVALDARESDLETVAFAATGEHAFSAMLDLPSEINMDTLSPEVTEAFAAAYCQPHPPPALVASLAFREEQAALAHAQSSPSVSTNSSPASSPTKKKKQKKKK
ncbi:hypothetical protein R3P38DRAFT_2397863, partial [Favolaschia claudopus]